MKKSFLVFLAAIFLAGLVVNVSIGAAFARERRLLVTDGSGLPEVSMSAEGLIGSLNEMPRVEVLTTMVEVDHKKDNLLKGKDGLSVDGATMVPRTIKTGRQVVLG